MKFTVNGRDFKNAIDRVMAIMARKPVIDTLNYIRIVSGADNITISATNLENFINVVVDADITELGEVYIDKDSVVKVYGLEDFITLEFNGKTLISKNRKKCCEVPAVILEEKDYPNFPMLDESIPCVLKNSKHEIIEAFTAMDCIRSQSTARPILTGFNLSGENKWIAVCDSHRLAVKKLSGEFYKTDFNAVLSGEGCINLKKIGKSKQDSTIELYIGTPSGCSAPFAFFKGEDFEYCIRLLEGDYINIEKTLSYNKDYSFEINASELIGISKEYSKEHDASMFIIKSNGRMFTAIKSSNYQTADVLETVEHDTSVNDEYCFCADPQYIKDGINLFKNDSIIKVYGELRNSAQTGSIICPIIFKGESYTSLILPINSSSETNTSIRKFVEKI